MSPRALLKSKYILIESSKRSFREVKFRSRLRSTRHKVKNSNDNFR